MGYDTIHETAIADILAFLKDGIAIAKDAVSKSSDLRYTSSIAKASKGLIMEFPVLVSKANHIESAAIVAKAYEAKFVTMLQMVFSATNITHAKDGFEYIKKFHANLDEKMLTVDEFIDVMDRYVSEHSSTISADSYTTYRAITEDMKNLSFYFADDINESSLNSYKIFKNYSGLHVVKEDAIDDEEKRQEKERKEKQENRDERRTTADWLRTKSQVKRNMKQNKMDDEDLKLKMAQDKRDEEDLGFKRDRNARDAQSHAMNMLQTQNDLFANQLLSSDVKKANELVPTMMIVNFIKETNNGPINSSVVIGVKAKLYEVEPMDVINKIITKNVDNNLLLKLVKVSTREISFVKDFLLAIDDAKLTALSKSKKGSTNKLFKVLERRALGGKIRKKLKLRDYSMAISSLVISQEESEELLKNNIDVSNPKVIRPIMEQLNLISFAIIDESSESVRFIFDSGDDVFETIPLSKLEKEQRDGMSKKVINLLAKMNR